MTGTLRDYHAPVWDEPVVMELGVRGRRGQIFPAPEAEVTKAVGRAGDLVPASMRRKAPPALPELTEPEVQRHYLKLSQETLGMMGISLFGTCTMKYNARVSEDAARKLQDVHPLQHEDTLQGVLEIVHGFDLILRELSGMDQFVFQAGGGAAAAYTNCVVMRAYFQARGELEQRNEIVTSIQAHPCNAATAAAAGFKVVTLMLEENGYPSVAALKSAVGPRTAALLINNPDDMGLYNPHIKDWVRIVHEAGGLAFYDHANFNGVMSKLRARDLGFDACMYMLHKTFGAPKGGGGPAVGAYGCSATLAPFLPAPIVVHDGERYALDYDRPRSAGRVREFWGNVPQVLKSYAWVRAMGAEGLETASNISVLANNYMDQKLAGIRGLTRSNAANKQWRMEMTRWSLGTMKEETGVGARTIDDTRCRDLAPARRHTIAARFGADPRDLGERHDLGAMASRRRGIGRRSLQRIGLALLRAEGAPDHALADIGREPAQIGLPQQLDLHALRPLDGCLACDIAHLLVCLGDQQSTRR